MTQEQFEHLYSAYYMRVFSYVMTLCGDQTRAEEITQETFFRAFTRQSGFRGEADVLTWLCAIAKHFFLDEQRRKKPVVLPQTEIPDPDRSPERTAEDRDSAFRIHMALHTLEEPYREVFELRIFGELSFREIGMIFGKTENWARVTFHRARIRLQERIGEK